MPDFVRLIIFSLILFGLTGVDAAPENTRQCEQTTKQIYQDISPAVAYIVVVKINPFSAKKRVQWGVGSGFIIDREGLVVTNAHVVQDLDEVAVLLPGDEKFSADVVGVDPITDLAVLRLNGRPKGGVVATLGNSDNLSIGEDVIAIGNALGLENTVSQGIVSGLNRNLKTSSMSWLVPYIQTDASINPGNSGGPLVNRCGEVVGITTLKSEKGENIGFAVPISVVKRIIPMLLEHGRVIRPWHGVNGQLVDPAIGLLSFRLYKNILPLWTGCGVLVETIEPGSAADKAGLRGGDLPLKIGKRELIMGGDLIYSINGKEICDTDTLLKVVSSLKVNDSVKVEYLRGEEIKEVEVVLPERPVMEGDFENLKR